MAEVTWTVPDPLNEEAKTLSVYLTELCEATHTVQKEAGVPISTFVNASKGENFKNLSIEQLRSALSNTKLLEFYGFSSLEEILGRGWHPMERGYKTKKPLWCYHILNDFREVLNKLKGISWFEQFTAAPVMIFFNKVNSQDLIFAPEQGAYFSDSAYPGWLAFTGDKGIWNYDSIYAFGIYLRNYNTSSVSLIMSSQAESGINHNIYLKAEGNMNFSQQMLSFAGAQAFIQHLTEYRYTFQPAVQHFKYYLTPQSEISWKGIINHFNAYTQFPTSYDYGSRVQIYILIVLKKIYKAVIGYNIEKLGGQTYPPTYGIQMTESEFTSMDTGRNLYSDFYNQYGDTFSDYALDYIRILLKGQTLCNAYDSWGTHWVIGAGSHKIDVSIDDIKITNLKPEAYPGV